MAAAVDDQRRAFIDAAVDAGLDALERLPAIASGSIQHGTMHGKLNGVMPATTPSGCRNVQLSMLVETCSV